MTTSFGPSKYVPGLTYKCASSDWQLWFEGGGNNFGIATEFVLKTHKQGKVYVSCPNLQATFIYGSFLGRGPNFWQVPRWPCQRGDHQIYRQGTAQSCYRRRFQVLSGSWCSGGCLFKSFSRLSTHHRLELLRQFKFTLMAYYSRGKPTNPRDDPFTDFLDIPHDGDLTELSYTSQDEGSSGTTLAQSPFANLGNVLISLYDPIPANFAISLYNNTMITTPVYNQNSTVVSTQTHSSTDVAINNAPRPFPSELAGLGIKSGRYVNVETV